MAEEVAADTPAEDNPQHRGGAPYRDRSTADKLAARHVATPYPIARLVPANRLADRGKSIEQSSQVEQL
jgi:hypothetical protein